MPEALGVAEAKFPSKSCHALGPDGAEAATAAGAAFAVAAAGAEAGAALAGAAALFSAGASPHLFPHSGQNFAPASNLVPHSEQKGMFQPSIK